MELLADTCFLIDLWREQRRAGPATAFSMRLRDTALGIAWVTAGEFLGGGTLAGHDPDLLRGMLARYPQVHSDEETVAAYARLYAHCRKAARAIALPDLWIAAAAIRHQVPLLTRNARDFDGLPDLQVQDYSAR